MERLEKVNSFQEFVQIFSQFGNEMVEFAHLTGDRQNVCYLPHLKIFKYMHTFEWRCDLCDHLGWFLCLLNYSLGVESLS